MRSNNVGANLAKAKFLVYGGLSPVRRAGEARTAVIEGKALALTGHKARALQPSVENNQVGMMGGATQRLPPWLLAYSGQQREKGDGVTADNATEFDPTNKADGSLIYPMPDAKTVNDWITAIIPDQVKRLVDYVFASVSRDGRQANPTTADSPA